MLNVFSRLQNGLHVLPPAQLIQMMRELAQRGRFNAAVELFDQAIQKSSVCENDQGAFISCINTDVFDAFLQVAAEKGQLDDQLRDQLSKTPFFFRNMLLSYCLYKSKENQLRISNEVSQGLNKHVAQRLPWSKEQERKLQEMALAKFRSEGL